MAMKVTMATNPTPIMQENNHNVSTHAHAHVDTVTINTSLPRHGTNSTSLNNRIAPNNIFSTHPNSSTRVVLRGGLSRLELSRIKSRPDNHILTTFLQGTSVHTSSMLVYDLPYIDILWRKEEEEP